MADYPDWVLAHKKKGTYINKVGDKYYLYAAHSERIPGTNKVRRVSDGYLGRITEKDGLIPTKDKVSKPVLSYEYALSSLTLSLCTNIYNGLRRSFVVYGDFIFTASLLTFIYGFFSQELFCHSWLSLRFPNLSFPPGLTNAQKNGIERGTRMISDSMGRHFGPDLMPLKAACSLATMVSVNGRFYCPPPPESLLTLLQKYQTGWRPQPWQK